MTMIVTSEIAIRTDRMIDCMLNTIFFRESNPLFLYFIHVPLHLFPCLYIFRTFFMSSFFLLFALLFPGSSVFGRRNTELLFEYITEIVGILISHFFCDLIAFFIGVQHHFFCPVHSVIGKIGDEGLTCFLFKNGRKVRIGAEHR